MSKLAETFTEHLQNNPPVQDNDEHNRVAQYAAERGFRIKPERQRRKEQRRLVDSMHAATFPKHAQIIKEAKTTPVKHRPSRRSIGIAIAATIAVGAPTAVALGHKAEVINEEARVVLSKDAYDNYMHGEISHKKFTLKNIPTNENGTQAAIDLGVQGDRNIHDAGLIINSQLEEKYKQHADVTGQPVVLPVGMFPAEHDK